jgi:light-regulated signal transduction histidine kinase (bacteriophytochrome)
VSGEPDYRLLFEESPDILLVLLPDAPRFTMVSATRARLAVTQTAYEQIIGRGLFEVFSDDPADPAAGGARNLRASLDRVLATRAPDTMAVQKYDIQGPDGKVVSRYWSPKNIPILDAQGAIQYILHRVEDVTANEALREATESANRELDAFTYSVAHDLRAPLRAINGMTEILFEDKLGQLDDEGQRYLRIIRDSGARMTQLIEDLLKLSRISRSELARQPVDLAAIAREIARGLSSTEPGRKVEFLIQEGVRAEADPRLLRVALENLLGNAWKFTSKRVAARIEFGVDERQAGVTFFVRDDGAGFDMAYADKLFGVFQRLHAVTEFEGTGVGLATVRRIVSRHGGRIWAEGAVNKGATFFFTLEKGSNGSFAPRGRS